MVTVRKSKLLTPTSVIPENTYYYEFDCDTIAELPTATYEGTNVAHGSLATIIANGRQYRINGEGEWCIQRYDASDPILIEKTITENGTYTALDEDVDGYSSVIAEVPNTYTESDEGKVVDNGELVAQTARAESITANGTYDTTKNNSVTVDVVSENNAKIPIKSTNQFRLKNIESVVVPEGVTTILDIADGLSWNNLKYLELPSTLNSIETNELRFFSALETIVIHKAEGSIIGAPWGAPNTAQIVWTG